MARQLPPFNPVSLAELRKFWSKYRDDDIRRLILEVLHQREVIDEVRVKYRAIQVSWNETDSGQLVALFQLKNLLSNEEFRLPKP